MKVPLADAIAASQARVVAPEALPAELAFSIDSRTLAPGDAYVALRGASFDGHAFVADALARGASALVVSDPSAVPAGVAALVVADTTQAFLHFGGVARTRSSARVAAITGSAGKTTTKAFLAQILEHAQTGSVVATPANENNEIGVAKLLLGIPAGAAFVVVEFGARHDGEIVPLARAAAPDVAAITNIGDAHLEIFGSRERLAATKWGIFATGAVRVLCDGDASSRQLAAREPAAGGFWFAAAEAARPIALHADECGVLLAGREALVLSRADGSSRRFATGVRVAGTHNLRNVAAAAALALALGIAPEAVAAALGSLALPHGRYERIDVGDIALVYDAYNASESGMLATLASFASERASRRIAVLGSMAELGADAPRMHRNVGRAAARSNVAALLVGGDFASDLARGARDAGLAPSCIVPFANNAEATAWLAGNARKDDLVLLKASRRYRLEEIVEGLRAARGHTASTHG